MDVNDWILICFLAVPLVASCVWRWQREKQNREWADLHAPLSDGKPEDRVDAILRAAEVGAVQCSSCGFQNFRTKIFCAMCGNKIEDKNVVETKDVPTTRDFVLPQRQRQRNTSEWSRKVDVEGRLFWYQRSQETTDRSHTWPSAVVQFQQVHVEARGVKTVESTGFPAVADALADEILACAVVFDDPATADPTVGFSDKWKQDQQAHTLNTSAFRGLTQQDFPTRVAHFTTQVLARTTSDNPASLLKIDRRPSNFLTQSIEALAIMTPAQAIAPIRVSFVGEPAIDAGGVYREWFSLMSESIAKTDAGVFTCANTHDQSFYLNPQSKQILGGSHLAHVFAAGRLVGRALMDGNTLGFHLAGPLLKLMLGQPIGFDDLRSFDPELHKSLQWLVDNDGVDALDLDFTVCETSGAGGSDVREQRFVELVPGGSTISVTDANKLQYIDRMTKYRLVESVPSQLYAFLKGVHGIIPQELLALFNADELDYLLCGSDEIDVDDWERHTRYTQDLWHHPTRLWFWEIVREMPVEYQRRLLQFATGSSRAPLSGFSALTSYDGRLSPFTLVGRPLTDEGFVRSHSCFNRLVVPLCVNRNHLKRGLYALLDTDAYGFSMV